MDCAQTSQCITNILIEQSGSLESCRLSLVLEQQLSTSLAATIAQVWSSFFERREGSEVSIEDLRHVFEVSGEISPHIPLKSSRLDLNSVVLEC
jgi:hypothetical protein